MEIRYPEIEVQLSGDYDHLVQTTTRWVTVL